MLVSLEETGADGPVRLADRGVDSLGLGATGLEGVVKGELVRALAGHERGERVFLLLAPIVAGLEDVDSRLERPTTLGERAHGLLRARRGR